MPVTVRGTDILFNDSTTQSTRAGIVRGTYVATTSGSSVNFGSLPSWIKRITVLANGVSTTGTNRVIVQLGTSGGLVTSGYTGGAQNGLTITASTAGFLLSNFNTTADARSGALVISNINSNTWVASGVISADANGVSAGVGGQIALGAVLTQISITTNSADTFDAGGLNIFYE